MKLPPTSPASMPFIPAGSTSGHRQIPVPEQSAPAAETDIIAVSQSNIVTEAAAAGTAGNPDYGWLTGIRARMELVFLGIMASSAAPPDQPGAAAGVRQSVAERPVGVEPSVVVRLEAPTPVSGTPAAIALAAPAPAQPGFHASLDLPDTPSAVPVTEVPGNVAAPAERYRVPYADVALVSTPPAGSTPTQSSAGHPSVPAAGAKDDAPQEDPLPRLAAVAAKSPAAPPGVGPEPAPARWLLPSGDPPLPPEVLRNLSRADRAKLADILEPPPSPHHSRCMEALFRAAVTAAAAGETGRALDKLAELIRMAPPSADTLPAEPRLHRIQPAVAALVHRLTAAAKQAASEAILAADALIEDDPQTKLRGWDLPSQRVLHIARELFDRGTYADYVRSAALAQVVVEDGRWLPFYPTAVPATQPTAAVKAGRLPLPTAPRATQFLRTFGNFRRALTQRVRLLWFRAPLLLLLLGWLALGVVGGSAWFLFGRLPSFASLTRLARAAFEFWSLGLLALVGFGFYMRVRHVRFRR